MHAEILTTFVTIATALGGGQDIDFDGPNLWDIRWPATGLELVDVNGDEHLDAVAAHRNPSAVTIRLNDGTGGFLPGTIHRTGKTPRYVVAGDLDGDGDVDLATPDYDDFTITVLWNDGTGDFSRETWCELHRPSCMAIGDMDRDGRGELVVAHWDEHASVPSQSPGHVSVVDTNRTDAFRNPVPAVIGKQPRGIQLGDLDGDADLDAVTANLATHDVSIGWNDGLGNLESIDTVPVEISAQPRYLALFDGDGDGDLDIAVVTKHTAELWIYRNDGTGQFEFVSIHPTAVNPHSICGGDLDGDGTEDLAVACLSNEVDIYIMGEDLEVDHAQVLDSPWAPAHVTMGDLDGDGRLDIGIVNTSAQSASMHLVTFLNRMDRSGDRGKVVQEPVGLERRTE